MTKKKKTYQINRNGDKNTVKKAYSSDNKSPIWVFDKLDLNGKYAFDIGREDFVHKDFLDKMISYSRMSWQEIKKQTHDKSNKSKHHYISAEDLSKEAQNRLRVLHLEEQSDSIFSFALQNKLRIFGYRDDEFFHVLWYDPNHEICPVNKD